MKYINEFIKHKEYKGEKAIYRVNDNCGNTYYSDEYVNWLEEQLRIHDVVGRSEQLNCEHEWKVEAFDCYGMPYEKYCELCGKKEAI